MKILIASNNIHKIEEINSILNIKLSSKIEVLSPSEIGVELDVEEDADTLEGNALLKAKAYFDASGLPVIADDTGLMIDALNGAPGVYSARYAGEPPNDANNRKKVLDELSQIADAKRSARFKTVICYFDKDGFNFIDGTCEGKIIDHEIGENGFGYDSIFIPEGYNSTFAEMSPSEKNQLSHRAKAIFNLADWLRDKTI